MTPYWKSKLGVSAAQNYSENGVAVLGNPAMRDVIWPSNSEHPFIWIKNGYKPADPLRYRNRIGWVPDKPTAEYLADDKSNLHSVDFWPDQLDKELVLKGDEWVEYVPEPVNQKKWKWIEDRKVWRYELKGNWAEVADQPTEDRWCETVLCIKGEIKEYKDHGWSDRESAMGSAEWQVEHPDGIKMGWWSVTWRLSILALLLSTCLWQPSYFFLGYCFLCYTLMAYLLLSGQLSSVGSTRKQIIHGIITWIFAPIVVPYIMFFMLFAII